MIAELKFSLYTPFVRNAFLAMLAYRLRYFTGIITYTVFVSVHYFIWKAVYASKGEGAVLNGFTLPEMVTYVAVGWISRSLYFSDVDEEVDELVRSGQIGVYLIRPVNFQLMLLAQAFGNLLFRATSFALPLALVIALIFPVAPPASIWELFSYLLTTLLGFLVFAEFNFLIGLLSFSLKSIQGIVRAKYYLVQLLSGLLLPIAFFPESVQQVFRLLPFHTIASIPLQTYLGKLRGESLMSALGEQLLWVVILFVLGRIGWRAAFHKLTVHGG